MIAALSSAKVECISQSSFQSILESSDCVRVAVVLLGSTLLSLLFADPIVGLQLSELFILRSPELLELETSCKALRWERIVEEIEALKHLNTVTVLGIQHTVIPAVNSILLKFFSYIVRGNRNYETYVTMPRGTKSHVASSSCDIWMR